MKICIYGGTDLQGTPPDFISELAYKILDSKLGVIVCGGYLRSSKNPAAVSTDVAALQGARRYAVEHGVDLKDCYEAWVPEPSLDSRPDVEGALRMSEADDITVRVMKGRTPLGRRLAMVAGIDLVVTISGKRHTEVVIEQALEIGVPVLPIPYAGGDSKKLLRNHRERIAASFAPGALDKCLREISKVIHSDPQIAASAVVALMLTAKVGRCLVLVPYGGEHDIFYTSTIKPAVAQHMIPLRLDLLPTSEAIYTSFANAIQSSSAVIADITTLNENVMYEIGYSHGRGLTPLLYTRDPALLTQLPVYFRTLNVRLVSDAMPIEILIQDYLRSVKSTRRQYSA